ncbi:MAG: type II toxin-antitoxin system RelB/DinJ family antitoxin [Anaerolineaceae bacterium]|nr:type II toxin-antitoxin system RelB/DinJ family antitoxin [Anaerolineaceae bacterium]
MTKTSVISARIDPDIKRLADHVFRELGLTTSQAITLFYKQVHLQQGLPFIVKIPSETTIDALNDAKEHRNLEEFNSTEDLFNDLGI